MNRRKFIQNASLATAGGVLASSLPAWASVLPTSDRHVVLAVVAGISKEDFIQLFPKTDDNSLGDVGHLITDMRYNGQAAGHRLALESIFNGKYVPENQSGQTAWAETTLFSEKIPGYKFFVGADREFLKPRQVTADENTIQLCVQVVHPEGSTYPRARLKHVDATKQHQATPFQKMLNNRRIEHEIFPPVSEDWYIAETAGHVIQLTRPGVTVVHFMGADVAHFDATIAKNNRQETGWALNHLWHKICTHPAMENTLLLVISDFGRNSTPNGIKNAKGEYGTDHSVTDENTRRIACLLASPNGLRKKMAASGESIDVLPTLLHYLGVEIPADLPGKNLL